ncbi:hypothetical protein QYE76_031831 [Lolium multiflorum]|uniref:Retrotransposon gag domain-containing protein n=1 Tax=Lolium multiflorum TaxID=4521 RepID=A0AAD8QW22_LOLMU|nr:hypothetical protein QYE76_031831 [Lolium multiflorum]
MMQLLQTLLQDRETERAERQANIAALQNLAHQGHGNHDHPGSKLKNFQNTNPPVFSKTEEPLDADDWLQTMENNLEVAGVEANEKVLFATHYLAGPARAWWTSTRAMNGGQVMTWADFKLKFSKYHVPPGLIKKMRDEFRELKQGRMTVVEYRDRFLTLSRYAPDETDTTEKRQERFLNGLHDEMQTVLVNIPFADLEALVDSAIQMEGKLNQANENRKRRMMHQSGPPSNVSIISYVPCYFIDDTYMFYAHYINPSKEIFSELDEIFAQGPIFARSFQDRRDNEVGRRGAATIGLREGARAALWCGPSSAPDLPFRLLKASVAKPPVPRATIRKTFQRRRRESHLGGFRRSPPCRRGDSSPGGLFIAMIASGVMSE